MALEFGHGGHIRDLALRSGKDAKDILDFSANINPLGPPEWLRAVVSCALEVVGHYPDPEAHALRSAAAARYECRPEEVMTGNGSTELMFLIPRVLGKQRAIVPVPSYIDYVRAAELAGMEIVTVPLTEETGFAPDYHALAALLTGDEIVFLGHPNNPTGRPLDVEAVRDLASNHPSSIFFIDEAFLDLSDGVERVAPTVLPNIIRLISLTKTYAVPGLRLGIAVAHESIVKKVSYAQPPWSVSNIAQAVGARALDDRSYLNASRKLVSELRAPFVTDLERIGGITVFPAAANFLLIRIDSDAPSATVIAERLLIDGIAIRRCNNFGGLDDRFFRVAVRTENENERLVDGLARALRRSSARRARKHTPAVMFQGTSSNAGKSILTAALCRILLQDGHRVAPFKAQNMSLNSFVTLDGGEMGRAQVVQAQAARLEPDVRMNPVLLKPNSDTGSQVIVNGKPVGNMNVSGYVEYKRTVVQAVHEAYDSLAAEHDVIVLEGAGSPAEVNLKHHDMVNMAMARYANAPVLLVGDIDRGGVFASFVGSMEVLADWERRLIRGFVVNKFRGDERLLGSAFDYVLQHTGRPVIGTVPYITDHGLPEEDSVTFKSGQHADTTPEGESVEIAVIDLPHISNFTDFDALRTEPDVRLRIIRNPGELNQPDAVILPGSKNVAGDLSHLRSKGFDRRIRELVESGMTEVVGLCGGYQMIGRSIEDPLRIESDGSGVEALGYLPMSTVMAGEKTLTRVTAVHADSGEKVIGYEIHHGQTDARSLTPVVIRDDGTAVGVGTDDGCIWGTYLHGIFDADGFRRWFVNRLRERKGLPRIAHVVGRYDLEPAFDRLADTVRKSLDMDFVYRLLGL